MNVFSLRNFLRHLLFLLLLIRTFLSIAVILKSESCVEVFDSAILVPVTVFDLSEPVHFTVYILLSVITCYCATGLLLGLIGFRAAFSTSSILTFSVGMCMLAMSFIEFCFAAITALMRGGFDIIIKQQTEDLFDSSKTFKTDDFLLLSDSKTYMELYNGGYQGGWNVNADGDILNHSSIDITQILNHCCGANGRLDWEMRIPTSCCSASIPDSSCNVMVAYDTPCLDIYNDYHDCLSGLITELPVKGLLSLSISVSCLYLSRLVVRMVNIKDSDYSLADDNDDE